MTALTSFADEGALQSVRRGLKIRVSVVRERTTV